MMNLKVAAQAAGVPGKEIAARLHVTPATVSRWLRGKVDVPSRYVMALSAMLKIAPSDILPDPTNGDEPPAA